MGKDMQELYSEHDLEMMGISKEGKDKTVETGEKIAGAVLDKAEEVGSAVGERLRQGASGVESYLRERASEGVPFGLMPERKDKPEVPEANK